LHHEFKCHATQNDLVFLWKMLYLFHSRDLRRKVMPQQTIRAHEGHYIILHLWH
jgi:hypothetical protein